MRQLLDRLNSFTARFTFNQKVLMGAILGTAVLSVVIFSFWLQNEEMAVLFTGLAPEDASLALDELAKLGVEAELENGGTTIKVPESDVHRMRVELSAQGIPSKGIVGWGIFDGQQYGMTEFMQNVNFKRALEGELTKTIESIQGIQSARVHLVLPKPSIFKKIQEPATASVVLNLGRGTVLGERRIAGIQALVAGSVEGLEVPDVSVLDQFGVVLSQNYQEGLAGQSETQLSLKKNVDSYLSEKAQGMLARVLGPGRSVVQVDATLNFDRLEQSRETVDPNSSVVLSEERNEVTGAEGEGGEEQSTTNYVFSKVVENVASEVGGVSSLSVAVFVDGRYEAQEGGEAAYSPLAEDELQQIQRIVQTAVGYNPDRGDRIEVVNMQFQTPAPDYEEQGGGLLDSPLMETLPSLVGRIVLFVVAGVLLLRLKGNLSDLMESDYEPVPLGGGSGVRVPSQSGLLDLDESTMTTEAMVDEIKNFADGNIDDVADLVQAWVSEAELSRS
ncbi:MAG TPA: flagellar basal-body MS-ring/collar protein FliF [Candidatus Krumholzibacteria bacterium]|nr:flagellar basal-body MS-ring/collar protein FliF [Candidatus Krumholzibacteria bacterium]